MPKLGDAQTSRFVITPAEFRIGPMSEANQLLPSNSVGLLASATVTFNVESVDLEGGLPKVLYDTAVTSQPGTIAAEMREYSARNISLLLGYTPQTYKADRKANLASDAIAGATTIDVGVGEGAQYIPGDLIGIYPAEPQDVANISYCLVASVLVDAITLDADTPTLFAYDGTTSPAKVFAADPIPVGAVTSTNYFASQVLGTRRDGQPMGFIFWKCAISSGLEMAFSSDDFGTTPGEFKILQPSASDFGTGGPLEHVAALIANNPLGMYVGGGDLSS